VTEQGVHRVILEATVGGAAAGGDIAIDDVVLVSGACPASGARRSMRVHVPLVHVLLWHVLLVHIDCGVH